MRTVPGNLRSYLLDGLLAGALCALGLLARLPNLAFIPPFEDEVLQTVYALSIRPGQFMPLVGNDAYAGPWFAYLLALFLRVFGSTPAMPRVLVMLLGALTVGATYGLARALGTRRFWAAWVGLWLAANPHHILVNSHYAGATYTAPLFSTLFLAALALAVRRRSGMWLIAASIGLGLALQATPVVALMLPGVALWFVAQHPTGIGWKTRWPYLAAAVFVLTCAPVIVYNVQTRLGSLQVAQSRTYAWQSATSLPVYFQNAWRLTLQLCRQLGGVLEGPESFSTIWGLPVLLGGACGAGLIYAARRKAGLLTASVVSHLLLMPWLSNSYGLIAITRYTSHLTPLLLIALGLLAQELWDNLRHRKPLPVRAKLIAWSAGALLVILSLWPLNSLRLFYAQVWARGETNAQQIAFGHEFAQQWQGEKILISDSVDRFIYMTDAWSEYNAAEYLLALRRIPYTMMPFGLMLERLSTGQETGRLALILHQDDLPQIQSQADLRAWDSLAMQAARARGYGVYTLADAQQVRKPAFVLTDVLPFGSTLQRLESNWADQLGVFGCELASDKLQRGERFIVRVYWRALGPMPEGYMGFVHLVGPEGQLVAQDDHELGRGFYRTLVWQAGEVIRERYEWIVPRDAPPGEYTLRAGVYRFPSLKRLPLRSANVPAQDDAVSLGAVRLQP